MKTLLTRRVIEACVVWLGTCVLLCGQVLGQVQLVANFDSFSEGWAGTIITDGGITFKNLDRYLGQGYPEDFCIEASTSEEMGPFFSPPNYLNAGGYTPGPGHSFGRFGSADIVFDGCWSAVEMDIFRGRVSSVPSNHLVLEALLGGQVVATAEMGFEYISGGGVAREQLAITGTWFDTLRLRAYGPGQNGAVFIGIDNVEIIPEPATICLLGLGGLALLRRKRSYGA